MQMKPRLIGAVSVSFLPHFRRFFPPPFFCTLVTFSPLVALKFEYTNTILYARAKKIKHNISALTMLKLNFLIFLAACKETEKQKQLLNKYELQLK